MEKPLAIAAALATMVAAIALGGCAALTHTPASAPPTSSSNADGPVAEEDVVPISADNPLNIFAASSTAVILGDPTAGGTADEVAAPNTCYSPLSLYMAMAMVGAGVTGDAQSQLLAALGVADEEELERHCQSVLSSVGQSYDKRTYQLALANSIWAARGLTFSESYLKLVGSVFDADAYDIDFGTARADDQMSRWVADKTKGLLRPQFQTTPDQMAALVNTLYFKDAWMDEFEAENTEPGAFHASSGDTQADFMHATRLNTPYGKGAGYTAAKLRLNGGGTMCFALPDEGTAPTQLLDNPDKVATLLDLPTDPRRVRWSLPKFTIDSSWDDLVKSMQRLGVTAIFDGQQRGMFTEMIEPSDGSTADGFYVDSVIQETHLALDEKGVEAAAYTAVGLVAAGLPPEDEPVDFVLDRPFIYLITAPNGLPLFIGTVEAPA